MSQLSERLIDAVADICPISKQTLREEWANVVTHGMGLVLAIAGAAVLITLAAVYGQARHVVGTSIFGATMILLYLASTLYHSTRRVELKRFMQRLDHIGIYLLIAGSYTPFALGPLGDSTRGLVLLTVIWALAVVGILYKAFSKRRIRFVSLASYLGMGWLAMIAMPHLAMNLSTAGFMFLIIGGLAYSFGTIFYVRQSMPFNHAVWHVFVLGGTVCHYGAILTTVLPGA